MRGEEVAGSLLRLAGDAASVGEALDGVRTTLSRSRAGLRGRDLRPLKVAGVLMVALPEPLTSALGIGLVAVARALSKEGLEDLGREAFRVLRELQV